MAYAPQFFSQIDQFIVEVHISRLWVPNNATFLEYGRLLGLMHRSGLTLRDARFEYCNTGEYTGVIPLLYTSGYLRRRLHHCENLLFARKRQELVR